ncbi:MAG: efflux RND transporter periplasmic adaptor subunit [Luteolibacter sp.]|uniref:efflux RND transporter periplasmic adaptor subunit n=1 Tax=Luteolibacter sp. TaxID=1962973 RepID=UPI003262E40D
MKTFITILITAVLAAGGTWVYTIRSHTSPAPAAAAERKPLFYQSPMHPWIKSDKPGRCTICGMELTPIYPGEKGLDATGGENVVALSSQQAQVLNVQTAVAKTQPLVRTLQVAGMIDDDATRHRIISAYVDGRVEKLHLNYMGAEVKEGQPLADFYSPGLLQTEREYRQLTGDLKKNTGLRLRQMGLSLDQIEAVADKPADSLISQILSPIGGTVVGQDVYEGQYVTTGAKLFEIADFSTMWFMFIAYEQDLPWIKTGQAVTITTPSLPGKSFAGKITFIDPNIDESTRSTKIRVELPNPLVNGRRELLHKLYADAEVQVDAPPVLTVPRSAIIETGPQAVVYTDQGGGAYKQIPVKIGRRGDTLVEITSGLKDGDKVATNGNLLIDGQAELNRSFMTPASEPMTVAMKETMAGEISEPQQKEIRDFLQTADAMAAALATDDLAAFNKVSEPAMMKTADLTESLANLQLPKGKLEALDNSRHFHGSEDLKSARRKFLTFSMAATDLLTPLRTMKGFPEIHIWQCPMVSSAIPGAVKKGNWIQTGTRPNQNPFFGTEMQDCGEEIKP